MKIKKDWMGVIVTLLTSIFFVFITHRIFLYAPHTFDNGISCGVFLTMAFYFALLSLYINLKSTGEKNE